MATISQPTVSEPDSSAQLTSALNCYLSTMVTVAEFMAVVCPEIGNSYSERLMRWPRRLGFSATPKALEESRVALNSEMSSFGEVAGQYFREVPAKAQIINSLVLKASDVLRERTENYHKLIDTLSEQMETGADLDDSEHFRKLLQQQVVGLRASSEAMLNEVSRVLGQITEQARTFQTRLDNPEYLSATDEHTGLLSRTGAVRQLRTYLESGQVFCALLFQVEGYSDVPSDQVGPLMKRLAERLVELIRPTDVASRWADDRFFIIFQCEKADAEPRAKQIAVGMSDSYFVTRNGRKQRQQLKAIFSIIESRGFTQLDQMLEHIDRK